MHFKTRLVVEPDVTPSPHALYELGRLDLVSFPDDEALERSDFERGWWWIVYAREAKGEAWEPAAYCGLGLYYGQKCKLTRAGVSPDYRGLGLQRRMIRTRVNKARALGFIRAVTYTVWNNAPSSNNLIRCGFMLWTPGNATKAYDGHTLYWYKDLA